MTPNMIMEEMEMIPVGWNSQKEAGNTQKNPGPVEDVLLEKETIPDGWNRNRQDNKEMIPGGRNSQREFRNVQQALQALPNKILAMLKTP